MKQNFYLLLALLCGACAIPAIYSGFLLAICGGSMFLFPLPAVACMACMIYASVKAERA